jgi:5-methylcytosine-specific restriction endonuclease McrA
VLIISFVRRSFGPSTSAAIRPGTDSPLANAKPDSRHVPNAVARAVWERDGMRCAFVSEDGRRCTEQAFLELHHIHPYALSGRAIVENLAVRCRAHNQYESELVFGTRQRESAGLSYPAT